MCMRYQDQVGLNCCGGFPAKYLGFGSPRRVAPDVGGDVNLISSEGSLWHREGRYALSIYDITASETHKRTVRQSYLVMVEI